VAITSTAVPQEPAAGDPVDLPPKESLRIGDAAAQSGVSERTLRYYEEIGLIAPAGHSPGGSRIYGKVQVERVIRIRELQELMGLNLEEIRAVLVTDDRRDVMRQAWGASEDPEDRRAILLEGISETTALRLRMGARLERVQRFLAELDERLDRYRAYLDELDVAVAPVTTQAAPRQPRPKKHSTTPAEPSSQPNPDSQAGPVKT
jgi:MerR family transcriptional regulator, repressor of the yfmOP operon